MPHTSKKIMYPTIHKNTLNYVIIRLRSNAGCELFMVT